LQHVHRASGSAGACIGQRWYCFQLSIYNI
jgi:hypothetical protein